jgi:hypothetical protein
MNDDMPWVDLTPEEIQQLRTNKQQLTQYGQDKIRQLMMNQEPYPDEMFEEAARREKENKVLDIAKKFMEENSEAMQQLAAIERKDLIDYALEELNAIVIGGQDTREFYQSVTYIRNVLERLK